MLSGLLTIDEDFGMLVDTLKVKFYQFSVGGGEHLLVFAFATIKPSASSASGSFVRVRAFIDVPIVWQIHGYTLPVLRELPAEIHHLSALIPFGHQP